ncbi:hypothetical protein FPV67DRAFT_1191385 [Lyophyllum atratum]|nr:hypothetical protein FPV67DRAFT_1191385 [Lyophyllum atratum]
MLPRYQTTSSPLSVSFLIHVAMLTQVQFWEDPFILMDGKFPYRLDHINGPPSTDEHQNLINHILSTNISVGDGFLIGDRALTCPLPSASTCDSGPCRRLRVVSGGRVPTFALLD